MYDDLFASLMTIITFFNRPQQDNFILQRAGISLDTALFPLLIRIAEQTNMTVVELAQQVGRSHTTVSRQVAKLIRLELVTTFTAPGDRRIRYLFVTPEGKRIVKKVATARSHAMSDFFTDWEAGDVTELSRLITKLAGAMEAYAKKNNLR